MFLEYIFLILEQFFMIKLSFFFVSYPLSSCLKAVEILEAYEGTLEEDYPPDNERCEHGEMLLYKVMSETLIIYFNLLNKYF